jgi:peptidoglycan-associated lipoprotein
MTIAVVSVGLGCGGKKVTVTPEEAPPPPPPAAEAPPPPPPPPPPSPAYQPQTVDVDAVIREAFATIYFDYDQTALRQESVNTLGRIANVMNEYPGIRVMAEGHADERGTSAYNVGLGEGRSKGVRDYLVSYGINVSRIEVTSYGKERPANPNCDGNEECHSKNRRVEWRILAR